MKKVVLIVRNLKKYTLYGNSKKVISIIPEHNYGANLACPIVEKIKGVRYSEKEGGYLIYGGLNENLYKFKDAGFDIIQIIRVN